MNELITRATPAASDGPLVSWQDKNCLIVDEIAGIRRLLRESLRNLGVKHVDQATSGGEAMMLISKMHYDIILCDYNLDEGKNGQQILEEARARNLLLPSSMFIIISAEKSAESVIGAAEHQPDAYLIKPITEGVLLSRLNRIWQQKQAFKPIDQPFLDKDYLAAAAMCDTQAAHERAHEIELLRMKANLLLRAGETDRARDTYEQVLKKHECNWAKVGIAKIRMEAGEYEPARQMFQNVIAENRFYIDAYDQLASAYTHLGQSDEACNVLEKAAKMSPNSVVRQRSLGTVSLQLGRVDVAEKAFRKCIAIEEHSVNHAPDAYLGLARICGIKNEPKEAMALLAAVQKEFSHEVSELRALTTKGLVLYESGDHRGARAIGDELERMLSESTERPDTGTCLDLATLLFDVGAESAPVDLLCYVIKNNDDDKALLENVQKVFEKASMRDEGTALILAARKEAADLMNQGVLLWKTGKLEEAVEWMRAARAALPNNLRILFNSAQILISFMQHRGKDNDLAAEAKQVLLHVDRIAPGQHRFSELMAQLAALAPETVIDTSA